METLKHSTVLILLTFILISAVYSDKYESNWRSIDSRPLPKWYDQAKFGIFLHWGVYSVPGFQSEWFWSKWKISNSSSIRNFMEENYPPEFTYQDFARDFKAEFFNPVEWAKLFEEAGAKYVVLTSKHHEGYTLWPSTQTFSWNSQDVGPHRDLVGELANAIRQNTSLKFGTYHSLYEWFNPMYLKDKHNNFTTSTFVDNKIHPDLKELIINYTPDIIWSDGDGEAKDTYWKSTDFLAWLYNESPVKDTVVVNDRWGSGIQCHHGGFYTCMDRYNPGQLQSHKWENCMTVDKHSWGFRRNARIADYLTTKELIKELVTTVSCGGNLLMNVGPTSEGIIAPIFQDRLVNMGNWLKINGRAIYFTSPWLYQNDTSNGNVWYTCASYNYNELNPVEIPDEDDIVAIYTIVLEWPTNNVLTLKDLRGVLNSSSRISILGNKDESLLWKNVGNGVEIILPDMSKMTSKDAWALEITKPGRTLQVK